MNQIVIINDNQYDEHKIIENYISDIHGSNWIFTVYKKYSKNGQNHISVEIELDYYTGDEYDFVIYETK